MFKGWQKNSKRFLRLGIKKHRFKYQFNYSIRNKENKVNNSAEKSDPADMFTQKEFVELVEESPAEIYKIIGSLENLERFAEKAGWVFTKLISNKKPANRTAFIKFINENYSEMCSRLSSLESALDFFKIVGLEFERKLMRHFCKFREQICDSIEENYNQPLVSSPLSMYETHETITLAEEEKRKESYVVAGEDEETDEELNTECEFKLKV